MKYIKNENRYGLAYRLVNKETGEERKIEFEAFRMYSDTGNVARTGITAISDEDYAALLENAAFKKTIDEGTLHTTENPSKEKDDLAKELQEQKAVVTAKEAEVKAKDKEISELKAKLEAMGKKSEPKAKAKEAKAEVKETGDDF